MDFSTGLAEGSFAEQRLVVAIYPIARPSSRRDAENASRSWKSSPRNWSPNSTRRTKERVSAAAAPPTAAPQPLSARGLPDAELTRFVKADYQADRFSFNVDEEAIARAERFDGKLVLVTNVADLSARDRDALQEPGGHRTGLSAQERPRDRPAFHRLPDRIRAHALICFPRSGALPGDAHAPQSERQQQRARRRRRWRCFAASRSTAPPSASVPTQASARPPRSNFDLFAVMIFRSRRNGL